MTLSIENSDGPIGASISGIDLTAEISKDEFTTVREVIDARAVMVIRDQTDLKSAISCGLRDALAHLRLTSQANNDANLRSFGSRTYTKTASPWAHTMPGDIGIRTSAIWKNRDALLHALEVPTRDG